MISVIVPVYNAEKYVSICIESILSQTYKDYELILVDDGSTDDSATVCKKYVSEKVKYVYQENSGPDMARKKGVQESKGEYLMFVDADDYIETSTLEITLSKLIQYEVDLVCFVLMRYNEKKEWPIETGIKADTLVSGLETIIESFFSWRQIPGGYPAKLFKRELLEDYDFIENAVIGEDISGVLYALQKCKRVLLIPEALYRYYWNMGSISHGMYTYRHEVSLNNYIRISNEFSKKFQKYDTYISAYFAEHEMAVATAMSRSHTYDRYVAQLLRSTLRCNLKKIVRCETTPFYMKSCILGYVVSPRLFICLYRIIYCLTGR